MMPELKENEDGFDDDRRQIVGEIQGYDEEMSEEDAEKKARQEWEDKLQIFGDGVEAEAEKYEGIRKPKELQMLEDMRQYQGADDRLTELNGKPDTGASNLNVNITRKKTNAAEARLSDMLFPTDDKNWGLEPSPIPRLAVSGMPKSAPNQPPPEPPPQLPAPQQQLPAPGLDPSQQGLPAMQAQPQQEPIQELTPNEILTEGEVAEREAKARAALMEKVMEDQLAECKYAEIGRECIRSGCLLGTGVMKGPVILGKARRTWVKKEDEVGNIAYVLADVPDGSPGFEFVSAWDFFPDMSATKVEDCEIIFQRHWMTRRDLIRLAKRDDFLKEQIKKVLKLSPKNTPPDYLTQLRNMSAIQAVGDEKRYVVWEKHGPVTAEQLQLCGAIEITEEIDPLDEYQGVVWVCQGIVIKAAVNPMDTEDQLFSVFCFEKDDSCIFGYGVPYLTRQPQQVVRESWRMIMDNSGLSVGGQIIVNKNIVEPASTEDGKISWDITPLKLWLLKDKNAKAQDAFHVFEFPNHQKELAAIFQMAMQLADEESGIPPIAEGESAPQQTGTAHGLEMLMNNHNIVMRRGVKNWDDNMTVPNIGRLYDHNMQNNPDNDIKGDFNPTAKGSTALLQKETQSRNMLNLVNFLMTPTFAGWAKILPVARKLVTSMQHDPEELLKTQAEYDKDAKIAAQNPQQGDNSIEVQKMRNDLALAIHKDKMADLAANRQFDAALEDKRQETEMMKLSQVSQKSLADLQGELQKIREKSIADRTLMADEFKVKLETGSGI